MVNTAGASAKTTGIIKSFSWKTPENTSGFPDTENCSIKWCAVSLSEVFARGQRLEAGVFDVEAKQARNRILDCKYGHSFLLGEHGLVKEAYYPGRFKRIYADELHGEPFFLPSQMTDIYPKPEKFISAVTKCPLDALRLKENTLLLTRSGTIGTVSYVSKTLAGKIFSDDVIRITFKDSMVLGYVYTYLKSEIGNMILKTNGYGSVITHLEPEHLAELPIPDAPAELKAKIHGLIERSYHLRDESNDLMDEAAKLLIKELKLPPIHELEKAAYGDGSYQASDSTSRRRIDASTNPRDGNQLHNNAQVETFHVKLSRLDGRADASYHRPVADAITEHLREYAGEVTTVGDNRISKDVILPGRFKRVYVEEGHGRVFIGGKQLGELDPSNKKYLSQAHHGDRIENQLELHENMTLITCSGTIGKTALVGKHWENWTANQHIIRIVPASDDLAGYLYIFLSSDYGHSLITKFTYGSVVDEIDDRHVRRIPMPLLRSCDVQNEINALALKANEKRYEAFKLEQEAIHILNSRIIFAK